LPSSNINYGPLSSIDLNILWNYL